MSAQAIVRAPLSHTSDQKWAKAARVEGAAVAT